MADWNLPKTPFSGNILPAATTKCHKRKPKARTHTYIRTDIHSSLSLSFALPATAVDRNCSTHTLTYTF